MKVEKIYDGNALKKYSRPAGDFSQLMNVDAMGDADEEQERMDANLTRRELHNRVYSDSRSRWLVWQAMLLGFLPSPSLFLSFPHH